MFRSFLHSATLVIFLSHLSVAATYPFNPTKHVLATRTAHCPCNFVIAVIKNAPPLDFVLSQSQHVPNKLHSKLVESFSKRSQNVSHAIRVNGLAAYHKLIVPFDAHVLLSVNLQGDFPLSWSRRSLQVAHIMEIRTHTESCPVLLPQHPPSNNTSSLRIIGGAPVNSELAKYLVAIFTPADDDGDGEADAFYLCTGAIISARYIITASHCQVQLYSYVVLGFSDLSKPDFANDTATIDSVYTHPNYIDDDEISSEMYDIAYLKLEDDINPLSNRAMQLSSSISAPVPNSIVRSVGYGRTNPDAADSNDKAMQVDLISFSNDDCVSAFLNVNILWNEKNMLCAGFQYYDGCGVCFGDSGGPLIQYDTKGNPVIVGIAISVVECGTARFPNVYSRPAAFKDFLPKDGVVWTDDLAPVLYGEQDPNHSPKPTGTTAPSFTQTTAPSYPATTAPSYTATPSTVSSPSPSSMYTTESEDPPKQSQESDYDEETLGSDLSMAALITIIVVIIAAPVVAAIAIVTLCVVFFRRRSQ